MVPAMKHILVVDDNDDVRDVIADTLREYDYRVTAASDGSAMRDFLQTGDTVDCVVLDALMPGEASLSLMLHLKERNIPVILFRKLRPDELRYYRSSTVPLLLHSAPEN
jgi:CheY-like chemotaxis protein